MVVTTEPRQSAMLGINHHRKCLPLPLDITPLTIADLCLQGQVLAAGLDPNGNKKKLETMVVETKTN